MKLITSEKTAQKLKEIKAKFPLSPKLDYSNEKEIEKVFRGFSLEAKNYLDSQTRHQLRHSKTSVKFEKEEEIKAQVKFNYKRLQEQQKKGETNPIVKYCGGVLIASIFDALLIKSVEEVLKKNSSEEELVVSDKILKIFGIDAFQLRGFKTTKEKRNYLMTSMNQVIDKLLKSWKEKIENREKNIAKEDQIRMKKNEHNENSFSFLKIKTKYDGLRKKLTSTVVQKLNDVNLQLFFKNFPLV